MSQSEIQILHKLLEAYWADILCDSIFKKILEEREREKGFNATQTTVEKKCHKKTDTIE